MARCVSLLNGGRLHAGLPLTINLTTCIILCVGPYRNTGGCRVSWSTFLTSAVVAALVTGLITFLNNRVNLYATYKLDQKKELRRLIGRYHGRMLEAAIDWDRRMQQLYKPKGTDYMAPGKNRYNHEEYLYLSVVFRFLSLLGIARKFESEAFYIDSRIARHKDFDFLRYAKSFLWVMTDSKLTPEDDMPGLDHFRNDEFRPLLDVCYRREKDVLPENEPKEGELVFDWERFRTLLDKSKPKHEPKRNNGEAKTNPDRGPDPDTQEGLDPDTQEEIRQVLEFFDGIKPGEYRNGLKRRRWERLICLHLLTVCFIGTFGYSWQKKKKDIDEKRAAAIAALKKEAITALANESIITRENQNIARINRYTVLEAFNDNLSMIGMDGRTKFGKEKQIGELECDVTEASIFLRPQKCVGATGEVWLHAPLPAGWLPLWGSRQ